MAKTKFKTVDMSDEAVADRELKIEQKKAKKQAEAVAFDMPTEETNTEVVAPVEAAPVEKGPKVRGKKYVSARSQVDKTKMYSIHDGIELLKKVKFTKFDESLEVHFVLKEITPMVEVQYPHSTGKVVRVAILNDEVIADLDKGIVNFDVLLASPAQMGKITKFARMLGPKGLMPNPKNGTLINDPVKRKTELEAGKTAVKGEKKAPLMHTTVGKLSLATQDLTENIETLIKTLGMGKVLKATICTSMSPGIKVLV